MSHHDHHSKNLSPFTWLVLFVVVVGGGIWFTLHQAGTDLSDSGQGSTIPVAVHPAQGQASTTVPVTTLTYNSTIHQFSFSYPSTWKISGVFNQGLYANAIALIRADQEQTIASNMQADSDVIKKLSQDDALFFRISNNTSINSIVSFLYGPGVVVSNVVIGNRNIAHVVHSKQTDPTNWNGGSTEAYIFRNSLGEAIVVEANYSSDEPNTDGELGQLIRQVVGSIALKAVQ
jgi:hypothetical protein